MMLYFYKGTTIPPQLSLKHEMVMNKAREFIADLIRYEININKIKQGLTDELELIHNKLITLTNGKGITNNIIIQAAGDLKMEVTEFYSTWCLNICCLIILKVINNDNDNGFYQMHLTNEDIELIFKE